MKMDAAPKVVKAKKQKMKSSMPKKPKAQMKMPKMPKPGCRAGK